MEGLGLPLKDRVYLGGLLRGLVALGIGEGLWDRSSCPACYTSITRSWSWQDIGSLVIDKPGLQLSVRLRL
jgi:hypothetical protein